MKVWLGEEEEGEVEEGAGDVGGGVGGEEGFGEGLGRLHDGVDGAETGADEAVVIAD